MKKIKIAAALLTAALALTACGGNQPAGSTKASGDSQAAAVTSAPSSAEQAGGAAGDKAEETKTPAEGAPADTTATDTTAADTMAAADSTAAGGEKETLAAGSGASKKETDVAGTVSGRIVAVGMSAITVRTADGQEFSFLKEDAQLDVADGLKEDIYVTVNYKEEAGDKIATFITDAVDDADAAGGAGSEQILETVIGVVEDGTMSTVTLKLADGGVMIFSKEDAKVSLKDGLVIGNKVKIQYTSEDGGEPFYAVSIEDAE